MKNLYILILTFLFCINSSLIFGKENNDKIFDDKYPFSNTQVLRFLSCSNGKIKLVPFNKKFSEFVVVSNSLDLKCFKNLNKKISKKNELKLDKKFNNQFDFSWKLSLKDGFKYQIANIYSPVYLKCGESCDFINESLIKISENYYFLSYGSDRGIKAELIFENIILFKVGMSTHVRNLIFNIETENLKMFPNGSLKFYKDYVLSMGQKSYFKGGGAFWYDSHIDYNGNLIKLLERKNGDCVSRDRFHEKIKSYLIANEKIDLCI